MIASISSGTGRVIQVGEVQNTGKWHTSEEGDDDQVKHG